MRLNQRPQAFIELRTLETLHKPLNFLQLHILILKNGWKEIYVQRRMRNMPSQPHIRSLKFFWRDTQRYPLFSRFAAPLLNILYIEKIREKSLIGRKYPRKCYNKE
jgi:hypothetical protein